MAEIMTNDGLVVGLIVNPEEVESPDKADAPQEKAKPEKTRAKRA